MRTVRQFNLEENSSSPDSQKQVRPHPESHRPVCRMLPTVGRTRPRFQNHSGYLCGVPISAKDRRRNNRRLRHVGHVCNVPRTMESCPDVGHVCNVPGTMESCPTYFCRSPKQDGRILVGLHQAFSQHPACDSRCVALFPAQRAKEIDRFEQRRRHLFVRYQAGTGHVHPRR